MPASRPGRKLGLATAITGLLAAPLAVLATAVPAHAATVDIQILGTNDFHGRLLANGNEAGAAQFAGAVAQLRSENPNTIFAAAGDLIGASTFESFIQKDKPTLDALNAAGLDVSAAGNHEFDGGYNDLVGRVMAPYDATTNEFGGADWQYIAANVRKKSDDSYALPDVTALTPDANDASDGGSWTTTVGGVKVGFVGAVTEDLPSLVSPSGIADLKITSIINETNAAADALKAGPDGADVVILLVHEGAPSTSLADSSTNDNAFSRIVNGVDSDVNAIISGHTHLAYNHTIAGRPVVSAGQYGTNLNQLVFEVDTTSHAVTVKKQEIVLAKNVALTAPAATTVFNEVTGIVQTAEAKAEILGAKVLGKLAGPFNRAKFANGTTENRGGESTLGNLVAEAQRWATSAPESGGAQIAFMNPGGLRSDMLGLNSGGYPADLTYKQAAVVQPFANTLVNLSMTGAQIKKLLEQQWQRDINNQVPSRPFLRLGTSEGFRFTYDPARLEGDRITGMWLNGTALAMGTAYSVTANAFLATGGDNFRAFTEGTGARDTGKIDLQAMVDYTAANSPLTPDTTQHAVGVTGFLADYVVAEQVNLDVSSLSMTSPEDVRDTKLTGSIGGQSVGEFAVTTVIPAGGLSDEAGTASVVFRMPDLSNGVHELTLTGDQTGTVVTVPLTVRAGQKVASTLTATVAPDSIKARTETATIKVEVTSPDRTPNGTVAAMVDGVVVGGGELVNGKADVIVGPFENAGTKAITVKYYGDTLTSASQASVSLTVTAAPAVERDAATVSTTVSPDSVAVMSGRATVSVTVAKTSGTPTGAVLALVDGKVAGAAELVEGKADISLLAFTSVGAKTVEVKYFGDASTKPADSTATVQVVKAKPKLRVQGVTVKAKGKTVKLRIAVYAKGFTPTGKVTVKVKGKKVTKKLTNGKVTIKLSLKKFGKNKVKIRYQGDDLTKTARKNIKVKVKRG